MYPKLVTKVQCLENLIGVRTSCGQNEDKPFWLEDIEGVDVKKLSSIAKGSNLSGKDFGNQLINGAAREMMGDIELLLKGTYDLQNIVGDMCSNCELVATYLPNSGIVIKTTVSSIYQMLNITKLFILTNVTGTKEFVIDDGVSAKTYEANFQAGVAMPIKLNYSTSEKKVKIYFSDPTIGLGKIVCTTESSCGCGSTKPTPPFTVSGLLAGMETQNQYGFLPCVTVTCSYDLLVCSLINHAPNIFGLALLYKTGEKYFLHKAASDRNNESVAFNEEGETDIVRNYGKLYWAKLQGSSDRKGIKSILHAFLRTKSNDKCVVCTSKVGVGYVTG